MTKTYKHDTPYGVVYETYDTDKGIIEEFNFKSNVGCELFTPSQIAEIVQSVDDDIAELYDQGDEPRNLALELLRLQNQLLIERGH